MKSETPINKDLILRERLALQRTILANQSTFLAFLRTSLYFFIAGLTLKNLFKIDNSNSIEISFFISSFLIFFIGVFNYFKHKKMILENEKHIGDYKNEYYE
jgi:putative membrane protein